VAARADADHRLESLTEPELSIACFRYVTDSRADLDALNEAILRRLVRETPYLPSATMVGGRFAIRPCFINPRTTIDLVDGLVDSVIEFGDDLTGAG
jgi:aromatic-L-amino-acid decarboxylase